MTQKNCPNCGAPIDIYKRKCDYCDTPYDIQQEAYYADNQAITNLYLDLNQATMQSTSIASALQRLNEKHYQIGQFI